MSTTAPPRTKFPKQYIIDRIDARIASLKSKDAEGASVIAQSEALRAANSKRWIEKMADATGDNQSIVADALLALDNVARLHAGEDNNQRIRDIAHKLYREIKMPRPPWEEARSWENPDRQLEERANAFIRDAQFRAKEIISLEHARAYLEGTPVDEFSLHGLKELKLVYVISFNILTDTPKKGSR